VQYNTELQGYGNMTNVEKRMNRADLDGYKKFETGHAGGMGMPGQSNMINYLKQGF